MKSELRKSESLDHFEFEMSQEVDHSLKFIFSTKEILKISERFLKHISSYTFYYLNHNLLMESTTLFFMRYVGKS